MPNLGSNLAASGANAKQGIDAEAIAVSSQSFLSSATRIA
jgi:hypothetical protein